MAVKYTKWLINIPTFAIPRLSKIYPKRNFWNENILSGNPVTDDAHLVELVVADHPADVDDKLG
jgi:hypothetical protein